MSWIGYAGGEYPNVRVESCHCEPSSASGVIMQPCCFRGASRTREQGEGGGGSTHNAQEPAGLLRRCGATSHGTDSIRSSLDELRIAVSQSILGDTDVVLQ